jgi:tripartite-type tricarboxylate transporter receptor subunit TctC
MGNHKGLLFAQLAGRKGIRFDLGKMSWLANVAGETQVLIVRKALPFKTIDELKNATEPIRMGASGVGSSSYNFTLMVRHIMGINFKMSPGYSGSEADIAMMRGELDGQVGAFDNLRSIVENGEARVVLMIGTKRLPQFPDVPLMKDYATPKNQGLINLMHAMVDLGRPIAAPPKMPADRLAALRQLIEKTFKDPGLLAHVKKIKIPIEYTSGEETRKMFVAALDQPPEVIDLVKEMAKPVR